MNAAHRLWLIFAQAVTVCLGILFVVTTLRPDWLPARMRAPVAPASAPPASTGPVAPPPAAPEAEIPAVVTRPLRESYADAVAHAAPAVVNVYTTKHVDRAVVKLPNGQSQRRFLNQYPGGHRRETVSSLGSGVIVDRAGHVLTNYHVVEAADAIEVALADGRTAQAKVLGADPESDLAVLKLDRVMDDLPVATLATDQSLRVGDVVLAIGNPFAVGQTTTQGIVSALGRSRLGLNTYENFIQTDAAINPGNSGGALIDTDGNLVGINTAIYSPSGGSLGIGFSIPVSAARKVMEEILRTGSVTRGWLGIEPQDITPDLARSFGVRPGGGVIIAGVMRGGPAGRGGLRVGDIIQSLEGTRVRDTPSLLAMIAALPPGHPAQLVVLRGGKSLNISLKIGTRPGPA